MGESRYILSRWKQEGGEGLGQMAEHIIRRRRPRVAWRGAPRAVDAEARPAPCYAAGESRWQIASYGRRPPRPPQSAAMSQDASTEINRQGHPCRRFHRCILGLWNDRHTLTLPRFGNLQEQACWSNFKLSTRLKNEERDFCFGPIDSK